MRSPDKTQRLLNRASWDTFAAMGLVTRFAGGRAGCRSPAAGLPGAGWWWERWMRPGSASRGVATGVKRQYLGCAGRVANGISTAHLAYVRQGTRHALIGARQWIPLDLRANMAVLKTPDTALSWLLHQAARGLVSAGWRPSLPRHLPGRMSVPEAALVLGVSRPTAYRMLADRAAGTARKMTVTPADIRAAHEDMYADTGSPAGSEGRWHSVLYRDAARSLGLDVRKGGNGWSVTELGNGHKSRYRTALRHAAKAARTRLPGPGRKKARSQASARCSCPRRIGVMPSVFEAGPIICGACGQPFIIGPRPA